MWCLFELLCTGEENFLWKFSNFCVINSFHCESVECSCGQSVLRFFLGDSDLNCEESDCNTWNIVYENTPKNPEVIILANMILGPKSDLRFYVLNALKNMLNRHCRKLKTLHIMAISFSVPRVSKDSYEGNPKIPKILRFF